LLSFSISSVWFDEFIEPGENLKERKKRKEEKKGRKEKKKR